MPYRNPDGDQIPTRTVSPDDLYAQYVKHGKGLDFSAEEMHKAATKVCGQEQKSISTKLDNIGAIIGCCVLFGFFSGVVGLACLNGLSDYISQPNTKVVKEIRKIRHSGTVYVVDENKLNKMRDENSGPGGYECMPVGNSFNCQAVPDDSEPALIGGWICEPSGGKLNCQEGQADL